MQIPTTLRCTAFDSQRISLPTASVHFFQDREGTADSATDHSERELLEWLSGVPSLRALLLSELGLDHSFSLGVRVTEPFISDRQSKPGDIDLLVCSHADPQATIAIECKRVKIRIEDDRNTRVTKLRDAVGGIRQANALAKLGFSRVYLLLLLVTDGRPRTDVNFLFRGAPDAAYGLMLDFDEWVGLHPDVGILFGEITQPVQSSIHKAAMWCIGTGKPAVRREQRHQITRATLAFLDGRMRIEQNWELGHA